MKKCLIFDRKAKFSVASEEYIWYNENDEKCSFVTDGILCAVCVQKNVAIQKTVRMKNTIGKERSKMLSLALTILTAVDFQNGDFFRELYDAYKNTVYGYAYKKLQNHHDTEEVVQDVFFKVYRTIETFCTLPRDKCLPLIVIYTKNTAIDYLRKRKRTVQTVDLSYEEDGGEKTPEWKDSAPGPEEIVIDRERVEQIGVFIDALPEKQRHVILLRYRYCMSEKDVAHVMSMTEQAVRSCVYRAKVALRKRLEEEQ